MINKKTVLILGAGASMAYGYPSGYELRKSIYTQFDGFYKEYIEMQAMSFHAGAAESYIIKSKREGIVDFINKFRDSNSSIDLFLSLNPKHETIGKKAIALMIMLSEQSSKVDDSEIDENENWYKFLLKAILGDITKKEDYQNISKNNISIISFNYDRSLEFFLYTSLSNLFGEVEKAEIIEELRKIKIKHVYGEVAKLHWQDEINTMPYLINIGKDGVFSEIHLETLAKNIKVIYEERGSDELAEIKQIIKQAQRIFFLGFGYAKENLEILDFSNLYKSTQQIYGTALGMYENEILEIKRKLLPAGHPINSLEPRRMKIEDTDCLTLLRKHF